MFELWFLGLILLSGSLQIATSSTAEGSKHCPGYVYKLNNSLAEVKCPVGTCGLEVPKEQRQTVTWEIQPANVKPSEHYCRKIVIRSDSYFEWHEMRNQQDVVYTVDNVTTAALNICKPAMAIQGIDPNSGSLVLYSSIYSTQRHSFDTANAKCIVHRETCSSSQSMQITIPTRRSVDSILYQLSNPPLNGVARDVQNIQTEWRVGSSHYLCLSTVVKSPASSHWEQNGRKLRAKTVSANDLCVDCKSERCIRQAEQLHGAQKGGQGTEVLQVTWSDSCEVNSKNIQMLSLLRVSNVTMETAGMYAFRQTLRLIQYHVTIDWLHETSFVEEPSREMTVLEGHNLRVPCVINTAADTNLSQVYWSGPQGLITGISSMEATNSPEMVCQQNLVAVGRVFYVQTDTHVHSEDGTLAQVSLDLHICNAQQQDSGVYRCGVWTGESRGEFRGVSLTVQSTPDNHSVVLAALSVVAVALFVILAVLIVLLSCYLCERNQKVQQFLHCSHLRTVPPTKDSNVSSHSLIPHAQSHV